MFGSLHSFLEEDYFQKHKKGELIVGNTTYDLNIFAEMTNPHPTQTHEETIVIKGIPSQSTYTVTEVDGESNGYTVTQTNATGTIKADTAVSFVNTKNGSVPTLADMNTKIPFVLVILAIGGVGFLLWKKHKSVKE